MLVNRPELDTRLGERGGDLPQQRAQAGDEISLRGWVGLHVARSRHAPAGTEPPQIVPAGLSAHPALDACADPGGYGAPTPTIAVGMGTGQRAAQLRALLLGQQQAASLRLAAPVAHAVGPLAVVAPRDLADPVGRIARHASHGRGGQTAR
jgi:hypothetical protein